MYQNLLAEDTDKILPEKNIIAKQTEELCVIIPTYYQKLKNETVLKFQKYISDEFVKSITEIQYNNIIMMFNLENTPIDENSSLEDKKFLLAYYLLEKYRPRSSSSYHLKNDWTFKAIGQNYQNIISNTAYSSVKENDIIIDWVKENDNWYIKGMVYDIEAPLHKREKQYNLNKNHISKVIIDGRQEEFSMLCATIPLPFTKENLETYYPGGFFRFKSGRIFNFIGGCNWQLTDKANYFFLDAGMEARINVFFGNHFSISPEIAAIGKLNLITSEPAAGITGEGGLTFHLINRDGKDSVAIKTFYQKVFIFPFRKESNNFDFQAVGIGIYLNFDDIF